MSNKVESNIEYNLYYDESEHSRKITNETITASNFAADFIASVVGIPTIDNDAKREYLDFEKRYKTFYGVSELKSSIIKKVKYKFGLKSFKKDDLNLIRDVFTYVNKNNFLVYVTCQNKIEFLVNQLLSLYPNDLFVDADLLRYSVTKIINQYMPRDVIDAIYNQNSDFTNNLKLFAEQLLEQNNGLINKTPENEALKQLIIILDEYDKSLILDWNYKISFDGLSQYISEQNINVDGLYIDKEGDGKTLSSAIDCGFKSSYEIDSKDCYGVRMSDFVAGIVSRFVVSIHDNLKYENIQDGRNLKFLDPQWFDIDEEVFSLYKLMTKVIVNQNNSWSKIWCSHYSDSLLYFICLIKYFDSFESFDEYKKRNNLDHSHYVNGGALNALQERFSLLQNKLKIEKIKPKPNVDYYMNSRGAICYYDFSKHSTLEISEKDKIYNVLSVGFFGKMEKACVTILENETPVCYLLPDELMEWAISCVGFANRGVNLFPSDVSFAIKNNKYYADIL